MSLRGRLAGLALLCAAAAAYGSFVPLRWRPIGWAEGLRRAAAIPVEPVWRLFNGDFFTNVLVFLPIGFFAAGAIALRRGGRALAVVIGSAVLSALIELGQVYIQDRTPSWSDVYAQTLGGGAGVLLWMVAGSAAIGWVGGALRAPSREDRVLRLLGLYSAGWALYGLLPTVFPHLAHPQLHLWTAGQRVSLSVLLGPLAMAGLSAVPVGALACFASARPGWGWTAGPLAALGVGLFVLADRVRQVSFMPADGHLAAGLAGFSCGWFLALFAPRSQGRWPVGTIRALAAASLAACLALIALQYWAPFDFGVSDQALAQRVRVLYTRAPFHRYYWLPPLVALAEVTTLTLLALGMSVLVALALRGRRGSVPAGTAVLVTVVLFAIVEWGQLYLPSRRADPTDIGIAAAGAFVGLAVARALGGSSARESADR